MHGNGAASGDAPSAHIGFPVKCRYRGGHPVLGSHGAHLWISGDRIGHGEVRLTHAIPLTEVASVDVEERQFGGSAGSTIMATSLAVSRAPGGFGAGRGAPASSPKTVTDVTVRTSDGHAARWAVEDRGAAWVRERLTPALRAHGIPYTEDLLPGERPTSGRP